MSRTAKLTAVLLLSSCATETNVTQLVPANSVRDSAGIQIVQSVRPRWNEGEAWKVASEPTLSLGVADGSDASQLFTTVVGMTRFPDGRIAVALSGTSEIRFFDSVGTYINSAGRRGRGPGEFSELAFMTRFRGDSLITYDRARNTLVVFDKNGRFATMSKVTLSQEIAAAPRGAFDDGVVLASWGFESVPAAGEKPGPRESRSRFASLTPEGKLVTDMGRLLSSRNRIVRTKGLRLANSEIDTLFMAIPQIHTAVQGTSFYYGDASRFVIQVYAAGGQLKREIRMPGAADTIPESAKLDTATVPTVTVEGGQAVSRRVLKPAHIVWPAVYPSFTDLQPDALGNLWVRSDSDDGAPGAKQGWFVFDSSAVLLGTVQLPSHLHIFEIGDDYILGLTRDSLGVESVRLFALSKRKPE